MGGVLFSPLCGQLNCRSCLETAARQEKPEGGSRGGPLHRRCAAEPPRRGSRGGRLSVCLKFFSKVNVTAPSSVNFVDSFPQGEAENKAGIDLSRRLAAGSERLR